jgi:glycerol-3-phosphate acyltransferase PlsY
LIILAAVVIVTVISDYIVLGTVTMVVATPVAMGLMNRGVILAAILCVATGVILYKHRENFKRIWKGTEIGVSIMFQKDRRVKE